MKYLLILILFLNIGCKEDERAAEILSSPELKRCGNNGEQIQATIEDEDISRPDADITDLAFDGRLDTFGYSRTVLVGESHFLEFSFERPINCIEIHEYYVEEYLSIGDLVVYTSTDGIDWVVHGRYFNAEENIDSLDFAVETEDLFVRLEFINDGKGLMGMTPAIYLSEIIFFEE